MTDIYGTLGPSCADLDLLREMFTLGMTGMRLNLSHMTLAEASPMLRLFKEAAAQAGVRPQLLIDMQGPELRVGALKAPLRLEEGTSLLLCADGGPAAALPSGNLPAPKAPAANASAPGDLPAVTAASPGVPAVPVPPAVLSALKPGQDLLLDDSKLLLRVTEVPGAALPGSAVAVVLRGGTLLSRKSIALPGVHIDSPAMTDADRKNLRCAKEAGVTAVMQPFVRSPEDLKTVRAALKETGCPEVRLFAKIENQDGIRMIDSLIPEADEIVIARGDLGNAVPLWDLPGVQKTIAGKCRAAGKPFMVVTQMLASMEQRAVPTRAEVSDIFNAVLDGASSVMVTGETAAGKYPAEVIRYLVNTVRSAEKYLRTS